MSVTSARVASPIFPKHFDSERVYISVRTWHTCGGSAGRAKVQGGTVWAHGRLCGAASPCTGRRRRTGRRTSPTARRGRTTQKRTCFQRCARERERRWKLSFGSEFRGFVAPAPFKCLRAHGSCGRRVRRAAAPFPPEAWCCRQKNELCFATLPPPYDCDKDFDHQPPKWPYVWPEGKKAATRRGGLPTVMGRRCVWITWDIDGLSTPSRRCKLSVVSASGSGSRKDSEWGGTEAAVSEPSRFMSSTVRTARNSGVHAPAFGRSIRWPSFGRAVGDLLV